MNPFDDQKFKFWLQDELSLKEKSASDVISRGRRAVLIANQAVMDLERGNAEAFMAKLKNETQFINLPKSSQSGLTRAVNLYSKYIKNMK